MRCRQWAFHAAMRVVLPKILGLTVALPLLVLWTSAVALFGGMLAALLQLDLSLIYFLDNLPRAVPVANLVIGLSKGVVFGFVIAVGRLPLRPARQAEYGKPVGQYDQRGGDGDHYGDPG
jgi:ABC-type transporter Mla maintaining outer membrane lipid asymmetry permease subunit MlaE